MLGWVHGKSTVGIPQTNGQAENAFKRVIYGLKKDICLSLPHAGVSTGLPLALTDRVSTFKNTAYTLTNRKSSHLAAALISYLIRTGPRSTDEK